MKLTNMLESICYSDENVVIDELLETPCSKEVRIIMQKNQVMRDHASDYPITLSVLEGVVKLTLEEYGHMVRRGDLIVLEAETMHHLEAVEDSVLRLTIFTAVPGEDDA